MAIRMCGSQLPMPDAGTLYITQWRGLCCRKAHATSFMIVPAVCSIVESPTKRISPSPSSSQKRAADHAGSSHDDGRHSRAS